jgi:signal transduction histidine kinase/CheY-like chemotaxis protein
MSFVAVLVALIVLPAPVVGGSASPYLYSMPLVAMIAVFLHGYRIAVVAAVIGVGAAPAWQLVESLGWIEPGPAPGPFVPQLLLCLSGLVFAYYPSERWDQALRLAREHEEAAIRALAARDEELERRARAEEELQKAVAAADQASIAKSQFLASMSHELRTPLNAILGYSEILLDDIDDEFAQADLGRIRSSGQHLLSLINDVLDLSKIEAGKMELVCEDVRLDEVVADVTKTIEPAVAQGGNELVVQAELLGEVRGDPTRVRQVLLNLLSNAAKFTADGRIELSAERTRIEGRDVVVFSVRDTGVGISEEQLQRLFRPFTQADGSTSRKYGGTGLGLVLSRRFARMMGGDVLATSLEGEGSTFRFVLPCESAAAEVVRLNQVSLAQARHGGEQWILAVDDSPSDLVMMHRLLTEAGYRVVLCADPEQALARAREIRPSLITLDVHMPGLDGEGVLRSLATDPVAGLVPVLWVSIDADAAHRLRDRTAGFVAKPLERDQLLMAVGEVLAVDDDDITMISEDVAPRLLAVGDSSW